MHITDSERDYLASQTLGRLATLRADGTLQNSPVGFDYDPDTGTIDIGGRAMGGTRKFANVAATGVAVLVIDDLASRDPWTVRGVEIRGRAEAISGIEPTSSYGSGEMIRLHPSRVISWGLDPDRPGMSGRTIPDPGPDDA
ncbi:MAG TPA: PPOX class F420-dependent oxidoreductase [Acidimicrobiales bacterium]|jgi:pyridoxamine 5'-phosphate oxidase family protein|nr:PPOX class F420-dependent oxidoreductase [Acidimicrobiales bacterium]